MSKAKKTYKEMLVNSWFLIFLQNKNTFQLSNTHKSFFSQSKNRKHVIVENVCRAKGVKSYLSWLNKSIICVLPLSLLKKMKRLQCINHILLCT